MTDDKIVFCFPGQGSLEQGMGRDIAEAVPEAMRVFELGSTASGLNLRRLCFDAHQQGMISAGRLSEALLALPVTEKVYPSDANFILVKK